MVCVPRMLFDSRIGWIPLRSRTCIRFLSAALGLAEEQPHEVHPAQRHGDHADGHLDRCQCMLRDRSLASSSSAPKTPAESMDTRPLPVMRRAICGAASATNAMGPAAAVQIAVRHTPTTSSHSLAGSVLMPCAAAASSPISKACSGRESSISAGTMSTAMSSSGTARSQPAVFSVPEPQIAAIIARCRSALMISQVLMEPSIAVMPMPTMISRKPWMPRLNASR